MTMTTKEKKLALIDAARARLSDLEPDVQVFEPDSDLSSDLFMPTDDCSGTWVQAWVWIGADEVEPL